MMAKRLPELARDVTQPTADVDVSYGLTGEQ